MSKKKIWIICRCMIILMMIVAVLLQIVIAFLPDNTLYQRREHKTKTINDALELKKVKTEGDSEGDLYEYSYKIDSIQEGGESLIFFSVHQEAEVFLDNQLVYAFHLAKQPLIHTPGYAWNVIPIYESDQGKELRIRIIQCYDKNGNQEPEFYMGEYSDVMLTQVRKAWAPLLCGIVAIIVGIAFIIYAVWNRLQLKEAYSLLLMGLFSILVGTWKIFDLRIVSMFLPQSPLLTYIPLTILMFLGIVFVMYFKQSTQKKDSAFWLVMCAISIVLNGVTLILQFLGISDVRNMLLYQQLYIGLVAFVSFVALLIEGKRVNWTRRARIALGCMMICMVGLLIDFFIFYNIEYSEMACLGMIAFLIYIVVLGISTMKEVNSLMELGRDASMYEQLAYHDALTGLYNRTAFNRDMLQITRAVENQTVIMFDLNYLKECNDTYGHEKGDAYIRLGATALNLAFATNAKSYRIGGDEFCVIAKDWETKSVEKAIEQAKAYVANNGNQVHRDMQLGMAVGYAKYSPQEDVELVKTWKRADLNMYDDKQEMKELVAMAKA